VEIGHWLRGSLGAVFGVSCLLLELIRHISQNEPYPFVKLAFGEMAAMLGLLPKLLWSLIHLNRTNLSSVGSCAYGTGTA